MSLALANKMWELTYAPSKQKFAETLGVSPLCPLSAVRMHASNRAHCLGRQPEMKTAHGTVPAATQLPVHTQGGRGKNLLLVSVAQISGCSLYSLSGGWLYLQHNMEKTNTLGKTDWVTIQQNAYHISIVCVIQTVISHKLSCFLTVFHTCLVLNVRLGQALYFFTWLNICACSGQSVNLYEVISRSHAIFPFYLYLFVLGMTRETQQDKSVLKRKS